MIVMQYRFTLPADYDMAVIETASGKTARSWTSGLLVKAYLFSRRGRALR
jgi:hypothetical protein